MTGAGSADDRLNAEAVELQNRWCQAVDTHDLAAIQAAFTDGGTFSTRGLVMDEAQRASFFSEMWAGSPSRSTHVCRDVTARPGERGIEVTARLSATFILPDGTVRVAWGHYDDIAVRTPDGLRLLAKNIALERVEVYPEDRHALRPELDHVAVAVEAGGLARIITLFTDVLGGTIIGGGLEPQSGLRSAHVTFPGGGKVELLEPTADGPTRDWVSRRGPGLHHVTVLVDDVDQTVARLEEAGFRTTGRGEPTPMWHEAYVHPHDTAGCLVQIVRTGAGYGEPVAVPADEIVADRWTWVDRRPVRVSD